MTLFLHVELTDLYKIMSVKRAFVWFFCKPRTPGRLSSEPHRPVRPSVRSSVCLPVCLSVYVMQCLKPEKDRFGRLFFSGVTVSLFLLTEAPPPK